MAAQLTAKSLQTVLGAATIVIVVALAAYFYFVVSKVSPQPSTAKTYDLSVLTDMNAPDNKNVFLKTNNLPAAEAGDASVVTYQSDEIGKTDLTQLNQ